LEVEADFPRDLVSMMKENAAKKARKTVIGRTLGGRTTLKSLLDCLKLHLSIPLVSITLLTRGYFEILFEEEEGAKATRRLAAVEWSGLSLSFSRYAPNFDASAQGAEAQLTHAIKVQFPDLHEEFKNTKALTLMASKLGEVLEIEAADSYIKRPAGRMITIELRDISKLPGYIKIPSMAEGTEDIATIPQKICTQGFQTSVENAGVSAIMPEPATLVGLNHGRGRQLPTHQTPGEKMERSQEELELFIRAMLKPANSSERKTRGEAKSIPGRTKSSQKLASKQAIPRSLTSVPPPMFCPAQEQHQEAQRIPPEAWKPTRLWRTQQPPQASSKAS
jgi:hypothetical protein